MQYETHFTPTKTPQTEPATIDQVVNSAGGYVFAVDKWTGLDRFLILGSEGGSYYATEQKLTRDNAKNVIACLAEDGKRTVNRTVEISDAGRAPKNDPAIFVMALAAADPNPATRAYALSKLQSVARIGTHLFHFVSAVSEMRGWGSGLQRAVAHWYLDKTPEQLAYQVLKYQSRDGWSNRDVIRLAHIGNHTKVSSAAHNAIFRWIVSGNEGLGEREVFRKASETKVNYPAVSGLPQLLVRYEEMKKATDAKEVVKLIREFNFTREMIPTQHLNSLDVWDALLDKMPLEAMLRNLSKMTSIELIKPMSDASKKVVAALADREALRKARLHPVSVLKALKTYAQGHGEVGKLTWTPERSVVDALDEAFYTAFDLIEPTNKNWMLCLDVSGSMSGGRCSGLPFSPREGSAAMAMTIARSEKNWHAMAFSGEFIPLSISPKQRLDDVIRTVSGLPFDNTNCSVPMLYALQHKIEVDVFAIFTDSETYCGNIHPHQALEQYRQKMGRPAKLIVCAMVANPFSIANPEDGGMLDCVGFDSSAVSVMSDFARQ